MQSDRLNQVLDHLSTLDSLCLVLGMDFKQTVNEVHPSLGNSDGSKNISNATIDQLAAAIQTLRGVKIQRMQRVCIATYFLLQNFLIFFYLLFGSSHCCSSKIL